MAVPSGGANYSASSPRGLQWPEDTAVLPSVVTGKEETLVTGISTRFNIGIKKNLKILVRPWGPIQ